MLSLHEYISATPFIISICHFNLEMQMSVSLYDHLMSHENGLSYPRAPPH
jgi:hypothetical protein